MGHELAEIFVSKKSLGDAALLKGKELSQAITNEAMAIWQNDEDYRRSMSPSYSYNGSLEKPMSIQGASAHIHEHYEKEGFYDYSAIVPIVAETSVKRTKKTARIEFPADAIAKIRSNHFESHGIIRAALLAQGIAPVHFEVTRLPAARKAKATATAGKLVTRYYFKHENQYRIAHDRTYGSLTEARAAGIELLAKDVTRPAVEILSKQMRVDEENGSTNVIVSITRPEVAAAITISYELEEVKANPKIEGYLVAFDYHV